MSTHYKTRAEGGAARPLPLHPPGRYPLTGPRLPVFAFASQNARELRAAHRSIDVERNTSQLIENNQSRYALSVNFLRSRDARNRERKINEDPPLRKAQGWGTRKSNGHNEKQIPRRFALSE
jgi:hypothetical protein